MADDNVQSKDHADIVRTISSCEKEFEDIQGILEDLSSEIKTKIDKKDGTISCKGIDSSFGRKSSLFATNEITSMLHSSADEFNDKTNRMSMTDLDLMQRTIEMEIRVLQAYIQQNHGLDQKEIEESKEKLSLLQKRMYKCMAMRGEVSQMNRNTIDIKDEESSEDDEVAESCQRSVLPKEFEGLSLDNLKALLRHNSVDCEDINTQEDLLQLVSERLMTGSSTASNQSSWEPPDQSTLKWNNAEKLNQLRDLALSDTSEENELLTPEPVTPLESYFLLNPSDMDNYLNFKAVSNEKLTDWDPTTLLKDLYKQVTVGSRTLKRAASKCKKVSCMQGYLDKLPMNQLKVKRFRSWKRRFFQMARGKLYYYEDHKSETPFGHIDILGSEIQPTDNNTILIVARSGSNKLVLKCSSESERSDWLSNLKRMATIDTPMPGSLVKEGPNSLLVREGSLKKKTKNNDPVIIDLGATTIRAGLASDNVPVVAFPSAFTVKKTDQERNGRRFTESGLPDPHSCRCGFEAFYPHIRKDGKIVYPLKPSMRIDKYTVKVRYVPGFLEKVFRDLEVEPVNRVVVISHSRHLTDRDKEILLDYLFGQMGVRAVYMQQQALLSLYSYSVTSGLIVDIGDHIDILPVIEGSVMEKGAMCLPYAGQQVTEYLGKLLTESGYRLFTNIESYVVRYVKEQVAEVSLDFQEDMTSSPNAIEVDIENFNLPDDRKIIKVGNIKKRCTEGLFNPLLFGKDVLPLHTMVERSIKACEIDHRRNLCKNIFLSGGTSLLPGLPTRLEEEIKTCFPEAVHIKVTAGEDRLNAAYKGAIVITGLSNFQELLIERDEWLNERSHDLLKRWLV